MKNYPNISLKLRPFDDGKTHRLPFVFSMEKYIQNKTPGTVTTLGEKTSILYEARAKKIFKFKKNYRQGFFNKLSLQYILKQKFTKAILLALCAYLFSQILHFYLTHGVYSLFIAVVAAISIGMTFQAMFTLLWMLYAWDYPDQVEKNKSPNSYIKPKLSFSAIVPARNEDRVIAHTINSLANINYPESLKEIIVVCRYDDIKTISRVRQTIKKLGRSNINLTIFNDLPINKPHALNIGLQSAKKDVVVIFDAEDEPHKDIFNIANTVMSKKHADVLQSGVQLMNYRSTWFSTLNVLEYFFWFKSTLQFFAKMGIIPLGGNTVFFKKKSLEKVRGWDETCLTEDADIGIRLSLLNAKINIVYDEKHVTQEESPLKLSSFIKQRTRWGQGFLQILGKGEWLNLPILPQRFLAGYILVSPELQALMFLYVPISFLIAFFVKLPVWLALLSAIPFYVLLLQQVIYSIGLYKFTKDYKLKYSPFFPIKIFVTYLPFQFILGLSALRAIYRVIVKNNAWEKTLHVNAHRTAMQISTV
jgi:cellulose synthase/poly-beta-1,6-N-acetylglucosamine synthase-like glycosyltransferase